MAIFKAPGRAMVALMAVVALGITGIAFIGYCAYTLPLSRPLANETPPPAILYATSAGQPLAARGVYRGEKLAADHLPPDLVHAVVAIEDRRFFSHHGIDVRGILRAAAHNFRGGSVEGGSTITQQLARLNYLIFRSAFRNVARQDRESRIADVNREEQLNT